MSKPRRDYGEDPLKEAGISFFWQPEGSAMEYLGRNIRGDISMLKGVQNATHLPLVFDVGDEKRSLVVTGLAHDKAGNTPAMQLAGDLAAQTGRVDSAQVQERLAASKGFPRSEKGREQRLHAIRGISNLAAGQRSEGVKQFAGYMANQEAARKAHILHKLGIIDEKQAKLLTGQAVPADELDAKKAGVPWAEWTPYLKDLPPGQQLGVAFGGIAAAGAGATAGSIALANMLAQQGQQQQDFSAYAAAAQAANAY